MSGTMISDSKSNLGCITFPPSFLLPPPFLGLTDLVSSGTSLRIDKRGNRFSSRFASKKKKKRTRKEKRILVAPRKMDEIIFVVERGYFFFLFF